MFDVGPRGLEVGRLSNLLEWKRFFQVWIPILTQQCRTRAGFFGPKKLVAGWLKAQPIVDALG